MTSQQERHPWEHSQGAADAARTNSRPAPARLMRREDIRVGGLYEVIDEGTGQVSPKYAGVWKAVKINPRTIRLVNPAGSSLSADPELLIRTDLTWAEPTEPSLHVGSVVEPSRPLGPRGPQQGTRYVITSAQRGPAAPVEIALLGGPKPMIWPGIPRDCLRVISI
jgi:hypothetical protein